MNLDKFFSKNKPYINCTEAQPREGLGVLDIQTQGLRFEHSFKKKKKKNQKKKTKNWKLKIWRCYDAGCIDLV